MNRPCFIIIDENINLNKGGAYLPYRIYAASNSPQIKSYFSCHQSRIHLGERFFIESDVEKFFGESYVQEYKLNFSEMKAEDPSKFAEDLSWIGNIGKIFNIAYDF